MTYDFWLLSSRTDTGPTLSLSVARQSNPRMSMLTCAFCDRPATPTREHVIPRWYNDTPGDAETFSARAPFTHRRGDLIVRDVCQACNNGPLSELDAYGKTLYDRHFAHTVWAGESVKVELDGTRLLRWLLKLSNNSARAQNADVSALREYRRVMLGESPLTGHVRCWLRLVSPTRLVGDTARPARRQEADEADILLPEWFRLTQLRLPCGPAVRSVQRMIIVNSFAFVLLVAPAGVELPDAELERLARAVEGAGLRAMPITPNTTEVTVTAGGDHAAASIGYTLGQYPSRFGEEPNPPARGEQGLGHAIVVVPRSAVESGDLDAVCDALCGMVATRESADRFRQRVELVVDGYQDDPRELWQIPETREYLSRVFARCPFALFLAHPGRGMFSLLAACRVHPEGPGNDEEADGRMARFLNEAFIGLNELASRLALSGEVIREISRAAEAVFGPPDGEAEGRRGP